MGTLEKYTILELSRHGSGQALGMLLADQGAEVLKYEPPGGDLFRKDHSFSVWNRGKKSFVANMNDSNDLSLIRNMVKATDVTIENLDPGEAKELSLTYSDLAKTNPRLIMISLTGFPANHKYENLPSREELISTVSGVYSMNPPGASPIHGEGPSFHEVPYSSSFAALTAAPAVISALLMRNITGQGQEILLSGHDAMFQGMGSRLVRNANKDHGRQDGHPIIDRFYQCSDGRWINNNIGSYDRFLKPFLETINHSEWFEHLTSPTDDPQDLSEWRNKFASVWRAKTAIEWETIMANAGVPVTMCRTVSEWIEVVHAEISGAVINVDDPSYGLMKQPGITVRTRGTVETPISGAPKLGEHSIELKRRYNNEK